MNRLMCLTTVLLCLPLLAGDPVQGAEGYVYVPRSYYVLPPLVGDGFPVIGHAPIVVTDRPAPGFAPPAGSMYRFPARSPRARDRWHSLLRAEQALRQRPHAADVECRSLPWRE